MTAHSVKTIPGSKDKWIAVIGLLILSIALRPAIVSIGPILLIIQDTFDLTYVQASLLTTIPDICMGVFALFAPGVARRIGVDKAVIAAIVLLGTAILLRAYAPSTTILMLSTALVGLGIAIAGSLIGGWIKSHFPEQAVFFMGIYAAGLSLGATVSAALTHPIAVLAISWKVGAGIWALLCVSGVLSWIVLARRFKLKKPAVLSSREAGLSALPWKNLSAWVVAIYFGFSQFVVYSLFAWLAPAAHDMNVSSLQPGTILALFTFAFAIASFAIGALPSNNHDRRGWLAASTTVAAIGMAGLALLPEVLPVFSIMLVAIGLGTAFTLSMTLPLDYVNTGSEASSWTVFMLFVGYLIAALGPISFGALRGYRGFYDYPFALLLIILLVMLAMTPLLSPKKRVMIVLK